MTGPTGGTRSRRRAASARGPAALAAVLVALVWPLLVAAPAQAHAVLVSSNPSAGARLGATPGQVTLVFDEPLVPELSRAAVVWPNGERTEARVSGKTMVAQLTGNAPGIYRVDWKTVSQIDGHTITGSFRFGVAVPVSGAAAATPSAGAADIGIAVLRTFEYVLLLLMIGIALLEHLGPDLRLRFPVVAAAGALLLSGVLVVGAEIAAASGLTAGGTAAYLTNGATGWARLARLVLETGLLAVAVLRRRSSAVVLVGLCVAVALAGHGADVEPKWQGVAVNAAHLLAAGAWAGGILALALLLLRREWPRVGSRLLPRFSAVAPWAFAISVLLGAVQAAQLLGGPSAVVTTGYGLTLVAKAVVIAVMVPLSFLAWRRRRLRIRTEAMLAVGVVAAAAALAAFPFVPKEANEAAADQAAAAAATRQAAGPVAGDLTMGGRAGAVMVGLTVHPGRPGTNVARVYLASPASRTSQARIRVAGTWTDMTTCGPSCRTAPIRLHGGETVLVRVSGAKAGTATFLLPSLPARDGSALVDTATTHMDALSTYRVRENLSGIRSSYVYAVPHQMMVRTWWGDGPQDTLWRGKTVYRRYPPKPWHRQSGGVLAPVPYYPWNPFKPLRNVAVVGHATVAGTPVTVLTMFGGHGPNPDWVWFTLYVDPASGRVLQSRMWATNHFMRDRYYAFDGPVSIPDPGGR